ncbi:MAG TPA: GNAT family N-acetyltransferase [Longimicrobiaceae bacterium]|nr:GNAT family N-acetyltransferase [Longimicrobiaceae bacterium]
MDAIRIRPATAGDTAALAGLMAHLGYPTTPTEMAARLERILPDPDYHTLVAEAGGELVGMVGVFRGLAYNYDAPYARVLAIVVDPARRGTGVGTALMRDAEAWAREVGAGSVHLTTALQRDAAHRFYERLGYEATGLRYRKPLG